MAGVRRVSALLVAVLTLAALATGCAGGSDPVTVDTPVQTPIVPSPAPGVAPDLAALEISFQPVADGFSQPLLVLGAGDGSGRLFVAEKGGMLKVVRDGEVDPEPFLDLTDAVSTDSERGLLGVAFPEGFAEHGRFYVSYTDLDGSSVISRFLAEGERVDRASETVLLRTPQPYANHNGGHIGLGPEGYLYVGLGDGGELYLVDFGGTIYRIEAR